MKIEKTVIVHLYDELPDDVVAAVKNDSEFEKTLIKLLKKGMTENGKVEVKPLIHCSECGNYVPLDIPDQFGNIVRHTGRGYCKHPSQRGDRHDGDWCIFGGNNNE